jgi:ketosteroid isomerase-like protein
MPRIFSRSLVIVICTTYLLAGGAGASSKATDPQTEIAQFNEHYRQLHLQMDTAGIFALWADDGVDLMPGEAPLVGRKTIQAWVENIVSKMPGYKVVKQEMQFHDIAVSGDWASEWALEHQVVQPPDGKEPIETWGKMALVLHRDPSGQWKVKQEMWNAAPKQ